MKMYVYFFIKGNMGVQGSIEKQGSISEMKMIIGGNSMTGAFSQEIASSITTDKDTNGIMVSTSRAGTLTIIKTINGSGKGRIDGVNMSGVDLATPSQSIKELLRQIDKETLINIGAPVCPELIDIECHAMSMTMIDPQYPAKLHKILKEYYPFSKINMSLISFNSDESHFPYGAKQMKDDNISSLLGIKDDDTTKKVIDMIVFDSPSSKVLGMTFIGVFLELIDFINSNIINKKNKLINKLYKTTIDMIGISSYEYIKKFIQKYPLRGEIKPGQTSIKSLSRTEFNKLMSDFTKKVDCARLSYNSGIITKLYLYAVSQYFQNNKKELFKQGQDRITLTWEKILNDENSEIIIENILSELLKNKATDNKKLKDYSMDVGIFTLDQNILNINPIYLPIISQHMGIIPLNLLTDAITKMPNLLLPDERISETTVNSMIYTQDILKVQRKGDEIVITNKNNKRETFAKILIQKKDETPQSTEKDDDTKLIFSCNEISKKQIYRSQLLHGVDWIYIFNHENPPLDILGIPVNNTSICLEWLGFQISKMILNPQIIDDKNIPGNHPKDILEQIEGKFQRTKIKYLHPSFDDIMNSRPNLYIQIKKINLAGKIPPKVLTVELDLFANTNEHQNEGNKKLEKLGSFNLRGF